MKGRYHLKKILVIGAVLILILTVLPVGLSNKSNLVEKQICSTTTTDHYEDSIILIIGKCNIVQGPVVWIFGLYIPLLKRAFLIRASGGEKEQLNVIIRGKQLASYIDEENIQVEFSGANGILFWGKKSILTNNSRIFARCRAENIWITTYD